MAEKPRLRGSYRDGVLDLQAVPGEKPRYTARYHDGRLIVRPTGPRTTAPGHVERPEVELLREIGNQERGGPVQLTYFPTRTSNPSDPRTQAAGYDAATKTMRVEWGDQGAAYNYYQVTPAEWQRFKKSASPGKLINRLFNYKAYGPA